MLAAGAAGGHRSGDKRSPSACLTELTMPPLPRPADASAARFTASAAPRRSGRQIAVGCNCAGHLTSLGRCGNLSERAAAPRDGKAGAAGWG